ncbi:zf-HC2 domain-containing protein [Actinomadura oligospora]|uniref:zf-HC2 domain-containing protein n=1 Tax=Actinomadura oligospora TaxID=111804 RepID=UPI0004B02228|nr:zf-HC2 domain-containing protein [Actinomadura oligospora]
MTGCGETRTALGVYVLGAIDPAERARVEAHLASCPACRDELAALAGLPALLGRVDVGQIDAVSEPAPGILDGLLARVEAERRRPWYRRRPAAGWTPLAAAAAVVMAVGLVLGGVVGRQVAGGPQAGPRPSGTSSAPSETRTATDASTHVTASVVLRRGAWGTRAEITVGGVPQGSACRWFLVTRSGEREMLGSWYVPYAEGGGAYGATTMYPRDQIASFQVDTLDGRKLVTIRT